MEWLVLAAAILGNISGGVAVYLGFKKRIKREGDKQVECRLKAIERELDRQFPNIGKKQELDPEEESAPLVVLEFDAGDEVNVNYVSDGHRSYMQ